MSITTFGSRLRELRAAAGISQRELASRAGVHQVQVARYETGRHMPPWDTICRLADALGVAVDQFRQAKP